MVTLSHITLLYSQILLRKFTCAKTKRNLFGKYNYDDQMYGKIKGDISKKRFICTLTFGSVNIMTKR